MRIYTNYNHSFSAGKDIISPIWNVVKDIDSLNGLYLTNTNYLETTYIGTTSTNDLSVETWYNALEDTNYLYALGSVKPMLIETDSMFNDYPSLDFGSTGNSHLRFKFPVTVGTVVLVYSLNTSGSYIIYAPKVEFINENEYLHYDIFPPDNSNLWAKELKANSSIFNAQSRINGKYVSPNTFLPLNSVRILTIHEIANNLKQESIWGFGGATGIVGGIVKSSGFPSIDNSFKGKLAAVITFRDSLPLEQVEDIESALASIYINYTGVQLINNPLFRYLTNEFISFDLSEIVIDEWFNIESYELIEPLNIGLNITGSILSGTVITTYDGYLKVAITNSANMTNQFSFKFEIVKADPVVTLLPNTDTLTLVLSADKDLIDGSFYGLNIIDNKVIYWEDARRIDVPKLISTENNEPTYGIDSRLNDKGVVVFSSNNILTTNTLSAKTFVWVYIQDSYGTRKMLDTFPDIKGTGELWTVSSNNDLHGDTDITKLVTTVNRFNVNTLNYKLPLGNLHIIVATQPESKSINFTGFNGFKDKLAFFAAWDSILNELDISDLITQLAYKFFPTLNPLVMGKTDYYITESNVNINLNEIIKDITDLDLTYNLITVDSNTSIVDSMLTYTTLNDSDITLDIEVNNTLNLYTVFSINLSIVTRSNPLYLSLKSIVSNLNLILIPENDTITTQDVNILTIEDYRLNGIIFNNENTIQLETVDGVSYLVFNLDGSSSLNRANTIQGKGFILAYIKEDTTNNRFTLLGQESTADFLTGTNNFLLDSNVTSTNILNASNYVNGKLINTSYKLVNRILNVVVYNSTTNTSINRVAKDRVFTDKSVKGKLGLVAITRDNINQSQQYLLNKVIRDYFDSPKNITLLHFNNNLIDTSNISREVISNALFNNIYKKFGTHSIELVNNSTTKYILIENNYDYAFLYEDFTISFWLATNKLPTVTTDNIVLFNYPNLTIYINQNYLYVDTDFNTQNYILRHELNPSLVSSNYIFFNVELTRVEDKFYLFINGLLKESASRIIELTDTLTYILIGQTNSSLATTNINMYLDEFMVYRRLGMHTSNFTPLTSEYVFS